MWLARLKVDEIVALTNEIEEKDLDTASPAGTPRNENDAHKRQQQLDAPAPDRCASTGWRRQLEEKASAENINVALKRQHRLRINRKSNMDQRKTTIEKSEAAVASDVDANHNQ